MESIEVLLSVKKATEGPEGPQWIEAINKEKLKLESTRTWRKATDDELRNATSVIPLALLLSKKRDGSYKCRAVVLGNMSPKHDDVELYAPVVSTVALRTMLTVGARHSDFVRVFDLDDAFL